MNLCTDCCCSFFLHALRTNNVQIKDSTIVIAEHWERDRDIRGRLAKGHSNMSPTRSTYMYLWCPCPSFCWNRRRTVRQTATTVNTVLVVAFNIRLPYNNFASLHNRNASGLLVKRKTITSDINKLFFLFQATHGNVFLVTAVRSTWIRVVLKPITISHQPPLTHSSHPRSQLEDRLDRNDLSEWLKFSGFRCFIGF